MTAFGLLLSLFSCATTSDQKHFRNVLILGFNGGEIKSEELTPILNKVQLRLSEQNSRYLALNFVQKRGSGEAIWKRDIVNPNELGRGFDDVIIVAIRMNIKQNSGVSEGVLGQKVVEGKSAIRVHYVNNRDNFSNALVKLDIERDSIWSGDRGRNAVRQELLEATTESVWKSAFPNIEGNSKMKVGKP